ncbi:hypothetical protein MBLNU459_g2939t1 [Dothideomycetes sp. NU459]
MARPPDLRSLRLDPDSGDEDLFDSPNGDRAQTNPAAAQPEPTPSRPGNARYGDQEDRDAALRKELESIRGVNKVIEDVVQSLERAKGNMDTVQQTVQSASTLLNTWTRILSQTEHNQRLILNPTWQGASQDLEDVEHESTMRQQAAERRAAEDQARRDAAARRAEEEERRKTVAPAAARGTRARGRGAARLEEDEPPRELAAELAEVLAVHEEEVLADDPATSSTNPLHGLCFQKKHQLAQHHSLSTVNNTQAAGPDTSTLDRKLIIWGMTHIKGRLRIDIDNFRTRYLGALQKGGEFIYKDAYCHPALGPDSIPLPGTTPPSQESIVLSRKLNHLHMLTVDMWEDERRSVLSREKFRMGAELIHALIKSIEALRTPVNIASHQQRIVILGDSIRQQIFERNRPRLTQNEEQTKVVQAALLASYAAIETAVRFEAAKVPDMQYYWASLAPAAATAASAAEDVHFELILRGTADGAVDAYEQQAAKEKERRISSIREAVATAAASATAATAASTIAATTAFNAAATTAPASVTTPIDPKAAEERKLSFQEQIWAKAEKDGVAIGEKPSRPATSMDADAVLAEQVARQAGAPEPAPKRATAEEPGSSSTTTFSNPKPTATAASAPRPSTTGPLQPSLASLDSPHQFWNPVSSQAVVDQDLADCDIMAGHHPATDYVEPMPDSDETLRVAGVLDPPEPDPAPLPSVPLRDIFGVQGQRLVDSLRPFRQQMDMSAYLEGWRRRSSVDRDESAAAAAAAAEGLKSAFPSASAPASASAANNAAATTATATATARDGEEQEEDPLGVFAALDI